MTATAWPIAVIELRAITLSAMMSGFREEGIQFLRIAKGCRNVQHCKLDRSYLDNTKAEH